MLHVNTSMYFSFSLYKYRAKNYCDLGNLLIVSELKNYLPKNRISE